jgi:hypothetical protein
LGDKAGQIRKTTVISQLSACRISLGWSAFLLLLRPHAPQQRSTAQLKSSSTTLQTLCQAY